MYLLKLNWCVLHYFCSVVIFMAALWNRAGHYIFPVVSSLYYWANDRVQLQQYQLTSSRTERLFLLLMVALC